MATGRVLVTGGGGFIAGHCILQLLDAGRQVRTTVRSLSRETAVRATLAEAGMSDGGGLEFVAADLTSDDGWPEAVRDVDCVLHVASPVRPGHVENEDEVIIPAREGALRVLRAAGDAGVRRVVLTSAFHAVSWGHPHDGHVFDEDDWTILDGPGVDAYAKSKTLSERAAWDFVRTSGTATELVTLLPVAVMGPVLGAGVSGANEIILNMIMGRVPALPRVFIPIVDVRDVAAAHLAALDAPTAAGQRILLSNGSALELKEIARTVHDRLGADAAKVSTRALPDLVVRVAALFRPELREIVPDLGYAKQTTNARARSMLDWTPRDPHEAIAAAAESMITKGLTKT